MSTLTVDTIQGKTTAGTVAMPSGTTVQFKYDISTTEVSNNTDSYVATSVSISFTPKFATSLIFIQWEGQIKKNTSAGGGFAMNLYKDSSALTTSPSDSSDKPYEWYKDETRMNLRASKSHCEVAGNTTARTYTCKFKRYDSNTGTVVVNETGSDNSKSGEEILTVMEIKQ